MKITLRNLVVLAGTALLVIGALGILVPRITAAFGAAACWFALKVDTA